MRSAARALHLRGRSAVERDFVAVLSAEEARLTSRNAHAPHPRTLGRGCNARAPHPRTLGRGCNGGVHIRRSARCVRAHGRGLRRSRGRARARRRLGLAAPITQHYAQHRTVLPRSLSHQYRTRASRLGARARRTRSTTMGCRRKPFRAVPPIGSDSHDPHGSAHAHASVGGCPGAIQLRTSLHPA
jgi:hypothetical protein